MNFRKLLTNGALGIAFGAVISCPLTCLIFRTSTPARPRAVPARAMSHLEPGQRCQAWNELDVWVFRADRERWTIDELGTQLPIIKTGTELEVIEDAGDVGEWKGEWRLVRVLDRGVKLRLDTRDGRFAPGQYVDHEFCVQRCDLRVATPGS